MTQRADPSRWILQGETVCVSASRRRVFEKLRPVVRPECPFANLLPEVTTFVGPTVVLSRASE